MDLRIILIKITNIWRIILSLIGISPGFYGERYLWKIIKKECKAGDTIILKNNVVHLAGTIREFNLPILQFVSMVGIEIKFENLEKNFRQLTDIIKGSKQTKKKHLYSRIYSSCLSRTYVCKLRRYTKSAFKPS